MSRTHTQHLCRSAPRERGAATRKSRPRNPAELEVKGSHLRKGVVATVVARSRRRVVTARKGFHMKAASRQSNRGGGRTAQLLRPIAAVTTRRLHLRAWAGSSGLPGPPETQLGGLSEGIDSD